LRLTPLGYELGLIPAERYRAFLQKKKQVEEEIERLQKTSLNPTDEVQQTLQQLGTPPLNTPVTLERLLKRPEIHYAMLKELNASFPLLSREVEEQVEIEVKYAGYIEKQQSQVEKFQKMEKRWIPEEINYDEVKGLRVEAREKLKKLQPRSIGQASRISGVSPADLSLLLLYLEQLARRRQGQQP
jgi:tRNA uridine 5-carboxymethylaminomethyl modification enzyme